MQKGNNINQLRRRFLGGPFFGGKAEFWATAPKKGCFRTEILPRIVSSTTHQVLEYVDFSVQMGPSWVFVDSQYTHLAQRRDPDLSFCLKEKL